MMNINVISLNLCTQLAFKSMFKHKIDDGHVVLIASILAHRVWPKLLHFYTATKHAVRALQEGWRLEVKEKCFSYYIFLSK